MRENQNMRPGDIRIFNGKKSIVAAFGIFARKHQSGDIHIHITGGNSSLHHVTVCNNPNSKMRYNRVLFRDLKKLLIAHDKWPFDVSEE